MKLGGVRRDAEALAENLVERAVDLSRTRGLHNLARVFKIAPMRAPQRLFTGRRQQDDLVIYSPLVQVQLNLESRVSRPLLFSVAAIILSNCSRSCFLC